MTVIVINLMVSFVMFTIAVQAIQDRRHFIAVLAAATGTLTLIAATLRGLTL